MECTDASAHFSRFITFGVLTVYFLMAWVQANTHVNIHQDLKDVKLWQVLILAFYALMKFSCFAFLIK